MQYLVARRSTSSKAFRVMGCGLTLLTLMWIGGCGGKSKRPAPSAPTPSAPPPPATQPRPQTRPAVAPRGTLYERMGGESAVRAVVNDFVSRAAADPAVNFTRQGHANAWQPTPQNMERLKQRLVEFIATTAGGPMQYRGNDMVTAHRGMAITNVEFDALAGHLRAALEVNDVPRREREELLKAAATLRSAVVEVADAPPPQTTPGDGDTGATDTAPTPDAPPEATPDPAAPGETPPEQAPAPGTTTSETESPPQPGSPSPEGAAPEPEERQDAPSPAEPRH